MKDRNKVYLKKRKTFFENAQSWDVLIPYIMNRKIVDAGAERVIWLIVLVEIKKNNLKIFI